MPTSPGTRPRCREPELLRTYHVRHDSGLHVLAAPTSPEWPSSITADHIDTILTTLLESYDLVVIDAGSWLDERTMTAFEPAETIFAGLPGDRGAQGAHGLLEYLNEAGSGSAKSTFVLNNKFAREILKLRDVENALGTKVATELPYDPFMYLKAVNEGVPVVLGAPAHRLRSNWSGSARRHYAHAAPPSPPATRPRPAAGVGGAPKGPGGVFLFPRGFWWFPITKHRVPGQPPRDRPCDTQRTSPR